MVSALKFQKARLFSSYLLPACLQYYYVHSGFIALPFVFISKVLLHVIRERQEEVGALPLDPIIPFM